MFDLDRPFDPATVSPTHAPPDADCRLIPLSPLGCGMEWELVVSGPDAGSVWFYCESVLEACDPPRGFLEWYEAWLAEELGLGGVRLSELLASERQWRTGRQAQGDEPPVDDLGGEELPF